MEKLRSRFAYILVMLASRARDRKRPNREISLLRTRDVFLVRAMRDETASCKTLSSSNLLPLLLRDRESFFISSDEYFFFFSVCGYDRRSLFLLEILSESIYRRVMIFKTNERIIESAILILLEAMQIFFLLVFIGGCFSFSMILWIIGYCCRFLSRNFEYASFQVICFH